MAKKPRQRNEKPKDMLQYLEWLQRKVAGGLDRHQQEYESAQAQIVTQLEVDRFWIALSDNWSAIDSRYRSLHEYDLLPPSRPVIVKKTFESFLNKTFRKNVVNNREWPGPPLGKRWILPDVWLSETNDIVRTAVYAKYIDGVKFVADELESMAVGIGAKLGRQFEARESGYYAAHMYYRRGYGIVDTLGELRQVDVDFEIQLSTQVKELVSKLLHGFYELDRDHRQKGRDPWQWQLGTEKFVAGYLGHMIQYIEGMIVDLRDKRRQGDPK